MSDALWEPMEGLAPLVDYFECGARAAFFCALEKQVRAGRIPHISPILLSPLIAHLADSGNVKVRVGTVRIVKKAKFRY